ncbi:MAG: TonB-dependent receptor [Bacteroidota bacterium]
MLRQAELHSGAFPASRPNALSSVLEVTQREGRKDRFGGNFTLGATDFGFLFEGPMGKKSSFMLSARESFSQHLLDAIGVPVIPFYSDAQYKQVFRFNPKNELILTGVAAYDKYTLNLDADPSDGLLYNTGYIPEGRQLTYAGGLLYKHHLDRSYFTMVLSRNYFFNEAEKFLDNSGEVEDQVLRFLSKETENKARFEHKIFRGSSEWNYGVNIEQDRVETENFSLYTFPNAKVDTISYASDIGLVRYGGFVSHSRRFFDEQLDVFAGLRIDGNTFNTTMQNPLGQLSPRLSVSWAFLPKWRWNASAGIYYQLPPYVLMGYTENGALVNQDRLEYMRSRQIATGLEHTANNGYQFKLEGFYKAYSDYPFLLQDSISFANANANFVVVGNQPADASGIGRAYGLEFSIKQKYTKSYFWNLAYSFVVSQFEDRDGVLISTAWDNRHFATLAGGLRFGRNWQVGARWSVSGGSPWTPYDLAVSGQREVWDLNRRGITDYSRLNEDQLPVFHQLDIRVDKQINFKKWTLAFFVDIQNVYSADIAALPYFTVQRDEGWNPIVDPNDPSRYLTQIIDSDTGRVLGSLGVIIDY